MQKLKCVSLQRNLFIDLPTYVRKFLLNKPNDPIAVSYITLHNFHPNTWNTVWCCFLSFLQIQLCIGNWLLKEQLAFWGPWVCITDWSLNAVYCLRYMLKRLLTLNLWRTIIDKDNASYLTETAWVSKCERHVFFMSSVFCHSAHELCGRILDSYAWSHGIKSRSFQCFPFHAASVLSFNVIQRIAGSTFYIFRKIYSHASLHCPVARGASVDLTSSFFTCYVGITDCRNLEKYILG